MSPEWHPKNLKKHHCKHPAGEDEECWKDLLGKTCRLVTEAEYEAESKLVCSSSWIEYVAEEVDKQNVGYSVRQDLGVPFHEKRRYFVDDRLVKTTTSLSGEDIVTCYHEHFDRPHVLGGHKAPTGELRNKFRKRIELMSEKSKMLRDLEIVKDEP
jgi:hypothetical protein